MRGGGGGICTYLGKKYKRESIEFDSNWFPNLSIVDSDSVIFSEARNDTETIELFSFFMS